MNLMQLAFGYFVSYVLYGIAVKWVTETTHMNDVEFLVYSTLTSSLVCAIVALSLGWLKNQKPTRRETGAILFSGFCTAIIVPTTTLLYAQPVSVMVAMVLQRSGVIIISRMVDGIMKATGRSIKNVSWKEELAVFFALGALFFKPIVGLLSGDADTTSKHFQFLHSPAVMIILSLYLSAYFVRLLIMNAYKATSGTRTINNQAFFTIEQLGSSTTIVIFTIVFFLVGKQQWLQDAFTTKFLASIEQPHSQWLTACLGSLPFSAVAFFSVFLFLLKGRSATFAGLTNRLTSLLAGTTSTLLLAFLWGSPFPSQSDWGSFGLIMIAVALLASAEANYKKA